MLMMNLGIKRFLAGACVLGAMLFAGCNEPKEVASPFVTTEGVNFIKDGQPYRFIGTNFWYAPILGSEGEGGDRERLMKELDTFKELGLRNLRILVGPEAGSCHANSVKPYLQPTPGVLNDTLLQGLDFALAEMEKRDLTAVIYLTNSWDWSGGFGFYLRECGYGDSPNAAGEGYNDYVKYSADFFREQRAQDMYHDFVRKIVARTNTVTGRAYKDEPSIMSWQLCNEPRPFAKDTKEQFKKWVIETAAIIKSIDPNHLISTGSEGIIGCAGDVELCELIHADQNIDYLTVHIWPLNWGWAKRTSPDEDINAACEKSGEYIAMNVELSKRINKPMVIEEFGYCRQGNFCDLNLPVDSRDKFYEYIFSQVKQSIDQQGPIAGCNFWGWAGSGRPNTEVWSAGDDYLCDPPHEPQGWYSVFDCDTTTIEIIKKFAQDVQ